MKTLLSLIILLLSQFASAQSHGNVPAEFVVQYYTNEMPQILLPGQDPAAVREVWSVLATVEFCATVTADLFQLELQTEPKGNFLELTAKAGLVDCMGPTRRQTLRYPMPNDADTSLPFFSLSPIPVDYTGAVH